MKSPSKINCYSLLVAGVLSAASSLQAAPNFGGLKEALPAPEAAVLRWDRASGGNGEISYRIYRKAHNGWAMDQPVAEVQGDEWAIVNLPAGKPVEFMVRAKDNSGEDRNTVSKTVTPSADYPDVEWRGVWMTRFEWPKGSRAAIEKRISEGFEAFSAGNLNAVIFQVRGQGDTLYPSEDEPWSRLLSANARTFDPVAFAIQEAKKHQLEFHAWMNLSTIWQNGGQQLPPDRSHPVYKFADASNPNARSGLIHDSQGKPVQWGSNNYVWLTPGNPKVNAYVRKQVVDFVRKYDVDGLHWDDNTANPNGVSRDPVSVQRFSSRGNPMNIEDFGDWQRDQLTRMITNIYVQAKAIRPDLKITASPFGIADRSRIPGYNRFSDSERFGTTPEEWLRRAAVDALIPQVYWDLPDPTPNYGTLVRDWLEHNKTGRPIWPGSALGQYGEADQSLIPMQQRYAAICRALGTGGMNFFSYSKASLAEWKSGGQAIFPNKARVPEAWNVRAGHGQVMGFVLDSDGKPIHDAWVRIKEQDFVYLTSGDGFFGIPHLKPGKYLLQVLDHNNTRFDQPVTVQAGKTESVKITFQ